MRDSTAPAAHSNTPATEVPFFCARRQYAALREALDAALVRVGASGRYILGPDCERFQREAAAYCGSRHAIGCASGSDALLLALMALDIGPGDEVLVPTYTFFATASAVTRLGARPVFVDVEPAGLTIDTEDLARKITPAAKAILPVHLFGQCAEMQPIRELAGQHGLAVIEDACQAIGAEYHGVRAGALGDVGTFSFYPTKNLGGLGDGGLLTCGRDDLADRLRLLANHGMQPRYHHRVVGINSRLDAVQAAVLSVKLPHLDRWTLARQQNAARYTELFLQAALDDVLELPRVLPHRRHVWNQYVVCVRDGQRDALRQHLAAAGVGTEIYYPIPLHLQPCFAHLGEGEGSLPVAERVAREALALPMFPELRADEQEYVVAQVTEFFARRAPTIPRPKFLDRHSKPPGKLPAAENISGDRKR